MNEKEMIEIIKELAECNKDSCKDCKIICSYYSAITSFCEKVLPEGSVVLSKNEYAELNITGKYFNDALKQARKETAKEIFQEINHLIINDRATPIWVKEVLIKLAKEQYGVDVEK